MNKIISNTCSQQYKNKVCSPICHTYENATVFLKNLFNELLLQFNSTTRHLKDIRTYNYYTPFTTDDRTRMDLNNITKIVLNKLNDCVKDRINRNPELMKLYIQNPSPQFYLQKADFGDVQVWTDKNWNEELHYEVFVWDTIHYTQYKLLINVIKFINDKDICYAKNIHNKWSFPYYNIGIPSKDQMIPTPMDVIPTANMVLSTKSINANNPIKPHLLYINSIRIDNSNLVWDATTLLVDNNNLMKNSERENLGNLKGGYADTSLEYVHVHGDNNPVIEKACERNPWPKMWGEPDNIKQFPCGNPMPLQWNSSGIYVNEKPVPACFNSGPIHCNEMRNAPNNVFEPYGKVRWSTCQEPIQLTYNPTLFQLPRNCGQYFQMFDLSGAIDGGYSRNAR